MYKVLFSSSIYGTYLYDLLEVVQNFVVQCNTLHYFTPSSTRNRFCWPRQSSLSFKNRPEKYYLKKVLKDLRVASNYNSHCCIPLKISPLGLKKTIHSKKDFDSVYNWKFQCLPYQVTNVSLSCTGREINFFFLIATSFLNSSKW